MKVENNVFGTRNGMMIISETKVRTIRLFHNGDWYELDIAYELPEDFGVYTEELLLNYRKQFLR